MAHKFRELVVWQRAMEFVTNVYTLTRVFPQHEQFGLTSQLRRAATSIPLNIAEGAGSDSPNEFKRFLDIALKSTYETMTALELSVRLKYASQDRVETLLSEADEIAAMIVGLAKSLQKRAEYKSIHDLPAEYLLTSDD
jgi:four helix bundle protein